MSKENATMKAAVLLGPNEYEIQQVPVPKPAYNEVLCKIHAVAFCGSDLKIIQGVNKGTWPPRYPFIIGHEWAGEVAALGEQVKMLKVGQRVAGEAHSGCGVCSNCKKGKYNLCLNYGKAESGHRHYGHNNIGCFSQYNTYTEASLTPIPDGVTYSQASIVDAAGTALHAMELTGITPGGTVVIIGPGPIGLMGAKIAKSMGASRVIVVGRGDRLKKAQENCADYVVNFEQQDVVEAVMAITGNIGANEIFECSGASGSINQAIRIAKKGGKIALLGIPASKAFAEIDDRKLILDEITLYGTRANPNVSEKLLAMIASKQLVVDDLITHHYSLDQFAEAYDVFKNRKFGSLKIIVHPNNE